jgi:leucyl-tRNA synthetase
MAPPEKDLEWSDQGVEGAFRFLNRVWRFFQANRPTLDGVRPEPTDLSAPGRAFRRTVHETIRRVTTDIEEFRFNTAISALHELVNAMHAFATESLDRASAAERASLLAEGLETLVLLLAPFAPHLAEELWEQLGHRDSVFRASWPAADPAALERDAVQVVVQVDGRVRTRLVVPSEIAEDRLRTEALADEKVRPWLEAREVARVVVVPGRLVNIVTRGSGRPA